MYSVLYIFRVSYIICKKDPVKRFPSRSFQRGFHRGVAESIITIEGSEKSGDRVAVAGWSYFRRRFASTKRRLLNPRREREREREIGRRSSYSNKNETESPSRSLFSPLAAINGLNKARSVNNADATALELMYTQRKRHGHVGRGININ